MKRWAGQLLICALTCWSAGAYAQASATPPSSEASRPEPTFAVRPRETPVVDGLKGFPEAINAVFPQTVIQTCIVHPSRRHHN
jgi:hypothetical protein